MVRSFAVVCVALLGLAPDLSGQGARASEYDHLIAKHAAAHGVPETLVRRIIHIESKGNPRIVNSGNYGLMQIRLGTARAMGYGGEAEGLLDADTNMNYAVRYLAGAYRAAGGNTEQAIRNYQRGYHGRAKPQGATYEVASAPPQAAAPDPTMLRQQQAIERKQQQEIERKQAIEQRLEQRHAMLQARVDQQQLAEQQRVAQRQAILQERIDRRYALEQKRIEQQQAVEQKRAEQRQAMLQQKLEREQAKQQQRIELEQARQKPPEQVADPQKPAEQSPPSARPAAPKRAAETGYAWYNPMRYFKHPLHQTHPLPRER